MNKTRLIGIGQEVTTLLQEYSNGPNREMMVDPVLYGILKSKFVSVSRQHPIPSQKTAWPRRIDFRIGGSNPAFIEFAVRPPIGGTQLHGSQNRSELRKLCRLAPSKCKYRLLLLLDLHTKPLQKPRLKPTYDTENAGAGNFDRHSVRVVYVHKDVAYDFLWQPWVT